MGKYKCDGLVLRRRTWWLSCKIGGVRHQRKLGKNITRNTAKELAQVARAAILKGEVGIGAKRKKDVTFDEAKKKFLDWANNDKKPHTVRTYSACLGELEKVFGGMRLSAISAWQLESYKKRRGEPKQLGDCPENVSEADWTRRCRVAGKGAPIRCNRELSVLKMLFNRCRDWNLYEGENPASRVKLRKEPRQRLRFLESDEEVRLLAACGEPLRSLIVLGVHTGLRIHAEALQLRWEDVDLDRGFLTVQAAYAKNNRTRSIPLNSVVRATLEALRKSATGELVFECGEISSRFRAACATAKITGVTPHTLRHTFASRLVMSGADLRTVQDLGGWATISMVERYSHLSGQHKQNAIERLAEFSADIHPAPQRAVEERIAPAG